MKQFLEYLRPVFKEDNEEWKEILQEYNENISIFWNASAGKDETPMKRLLTKDIPDEAKKLLSNNIFPIHTDYWTERLNGLKNIYKYFDDEDFKYDFMDMNIYQMIPLTFFSKKELKDIRKKYTNFHSCMTDSVVPDDKWHFIFINGYIDNKEYNFLYGFIENTVFYKEIVKKFDLNIEAFCALRVGGHSGSWYDTHSPDSELFKIIDNSKIKPKLWIADNYYKLREIWDEVEKFESRGYGEMHFFRTNWNKDYLLK